MTGFHQSPAERIPIPTLAPGHDDSRLRSEERLRLVLEATRAGIWDANLSTGETYASAQFDEIMGYAPGASPRSLSAFIRRVVPEHRQRVLGLMRESARTGQPYVIECRIRDALGSIKFLHVRGDVLLDNSGRAVRIVGTIVDITAEAQARIEREQQDRFLAGINSALPVVVYAYDVIARQLLFSNRSFSELLGYSNEELVEQMRRDSRRVLHADDASPLAEYQQRLNSLQEGEVDVVRLRARHRDGTWRWIVSRNTPLRWHPDGSLWQVVGTAEDITDQVLANEQLRNRERELARAQELSQIGSWTWQFPDAHLSWSKEMYRIMGLDPGTTVPSEEAVAALIKPTERARIQAAHKACVEEGRNVDLRFQLHRPDGTMRHVHALAEVLRDSAGAPLALVGTLQDVTERVRHDEERLRLESKVHHAQKLESLGLLAGGIAHDFNNLLVGVLSNASLALLDLDEYSPAREVVLEIESTAQRAAELTRQLLAYSGKGRFVVETLNLTSLASEMAQLLRTVVSKDTVLQLELDPSLPSMQGDATQLRQVIMNLITNASDALMGKPGTVTVRTYRGPCPALDADTLQFGELSASTPAVCFEVVDTGCGMSRRTAERIFDPFFTTKFTGRGLGLAATLGIVRGHHGHIAVVSAPERGTRFVLSFPVAEPPVAQNADGMESQRLIGHGKVLVVDDDKVVRGVCTALLTRRGFVVESVESGRDALARLAEVTEPFRFVLLDLTMPGLSGIEVLQQVRETERIAGTSAATIFLMSGYSEQDVSSGLGDLTISGFLQKPFTISDLDVLLANLGSE